MATLEKIKVQLRKSLVHTVGIADADGQGVHVHLLDESLHFVHIHQILVIVPDSILHTANGTKFCLHGYPDSVSCFHHFFRDCNICLKGHVRPIEHHRGKARAEALDRLLIADTVIQVHNYRNRCAVRKTAHHIRQMQHLPRVDRSLSNG